VAEKFVADLKAAVARIMTQKDRKLGKIVCFLLKLNNYVKQN
jgi:hypothetical protein